CSGCFRSICKARCYFKHSGFDFGYCEKGICKCAPPIIYVFDGIGRDL
ncbi:myb-like protein U, partial [Aphis craccivora]